MDFSLSHISTSTNAAFSLTILIPDSCRKGRYFPGITNGSTKAAIAQTIGKDKSTIGKEIKLHKILSHKCSLPLEYSTYRKCPFGRACTSDCPEFIPFRRSKRDYPPGACNDYPNCFRCRFDKYTYSPEDTYFV